MSTLTHQAFANLAQNQLFEGIEPSLLQQIAPEVNVVHLEPGEVIFREGDAGGVLYLVGEGSVKISKSGRGGEQETLSYIQRGSFFGEMSLLDGQPRSAMACAMGETVLGTVDKPTFRHLLELAPSQLHMNFLRSVSERLRRVNSHFISEVMRTERLSLVGSMASSIIHDLKNPICIIRGCCELIAAETTNPRQLQLTKVMDQAIDGMLALTQELLDYARGQAALQFELVSIWHLLDELYSHSLCLLPGKNIQLTKDIHYDGNLYIDLPRFLRVLSNLVKNALEAMPNGGILTLAIERVDDAVVIRISDTGVGIPPDILAKLFEPFVTHGKTHGTGLGMAIAQSIITAHKGTISASSVQGGGTTIEIRMPLPDAR
jgi:signal transduction histidine kinase